MMLHIRRGKGKKDRIAPLFKRLLDSLRAYFKAYRPTKYLFEGRKRGPYATRSTRLLLAEAKRKGGILKKGSIHMLRHSYATHLLEPGTDIRYIQSFLGHNNVGTTMIYTHIGQTKIGNIQAPWTGWTFHAQFRFLGCQERMFQHEQLKKRNKDY